MTHLLAVRTVSDDANFRIVEGLAYPFTGRDTYGTFFSARTNFEWGLFPDVDPTAATRAGQAPAFIRPATFHHGFDPEFGLTADGVRVGGWSPVRMDADGVWVRAQIDKRHRYYETRLKPLLDAGALGLSGGSAEHSVRIDSATGEVLDWPAYELALTPVESNPLAQLAARSADAFRIVTPAPAGETTDDTTPDPAIREGRRNSGTDQDRIQAMHDHASALGADCPGDASARSAEGAPEGEPATPALRIAMPAPEPPDDPLAQMQTQVVDDAVRAVVRRMTG